MRIKNWDKQVSKGLVLGCVAVFLALWSMPVQALSILNVDGAGDTGQIIAEDEAVAISFELTQSFTDVSISAPINFFGASGAIWFQKNAIGSGASFADVIIAEPYDSTSVSPFATGLTLDPGSYFLIVSIDSGWATWTGSTTPVETIADGAAFGLEFYASDLQPFVPQTDFSVLFAPGALHYSLNGNAEVPNGTIPEPTTITLLGLGIVGLAGMRWRRSR